MGSRLQNSNLKNVDLTLSVFFDLVGNEKSGIGSCCIRFPSHCPALLVDFPSAQLYEVTPFSLFTQLFRLSVVRAKVDPDFKAAATPYDSCLLGCLLIASEMDFSDSRQNLRRDAQARHFLDINRGYRKRVRWCDFFKFDFHRCCLGP
jgi:hypothetical protein